MRYVESYMHHNQIAVLVELETQDIITTRCSEFTDLATDIAMHIAATNPAGLDNNAMENVIPLKFQGRDIDLAEEALLNQAWIKDPSISVRELIENVSKKLETSIRVARFCRFDVNDT